MASNAQLKANRENAQKSTGPRSDEGKAVTATNRRVHGLAGSRFYVAHWENQEEFEKLLADLAADYQPRNTTEALLVQQMAESRWLRQRALLLQNDLFTPNGMFAAIANRLKIYMRYQAQHDRAFQSALNQLLKLRAETAKEQIGLEREQQHKRAEERQQSAEKRRQETHVMQLKLAEARLHRENHGQRQPANVANAPGELKTAA
jgi:low affinity Fe/Cu permease